MIQLLDYQEYPVAKVDIVRKGFGHKADVERFVVYLHGLSQIPSCPRYIDDRIISCTFLQLLILENNAMLGTAQFVIDFRWMHK